MRYRITCLTPLLIGDGRKLSAIDYMVWKDQVNVLDQRRIFRLLSKGPRLEGYLSQLKRADKLDFASWGGFAQNYADRRIPFESPVYSTYWNRAAGETLNIPTFAAESSGPYIPGTAIKGGLRTGMVFANLKNGMLQDLSSRMQGERLPRHPSEIAEEQALGSAGTSRARLISAGDSAPVGYSGFKIHLLRTATLVPGRAPNSYALGWKQSPRGTVEGRRPEDSTPTFAEMAGPETVFEGQWSEKDFFRQPEVRRSVRWPESLDRGHVFGSANDYAERLLGLHRQYAQWAGLELLSSQVQALEEQVRTARASGACVLSLGWGGGLLTKTPWLDTGDPEYRTILQQFSLYNRALASGLPFPKTRRIVFLNDKPATLPGWVLLQVQ
jgi:CRISPR-associated protein Csm5